MSKPDVFDPAEYVRIASDLAKSTSDEAAIRSAINRAYYALFLVARDRLGLEESDHISVVAAVKEEDRTAGDQLGMLKFLRISADYHPTIMAGGVANWLAHWRHVEPFLDPLRRKLAKLPQSTMSNKAKKKKVKQLRRLGRPTP